MIKYYIIPMRNDPGMREAELTKLRIAVPQAEVSDKDYDFLIDHLLKWAGEKSTAPNVTIIAAVERAREATISHIRERSLTPAE